jgi:acetamidase/formamidase
VFHDGALFYFGDGHALQGDGEIAGSGLETTMDVTFQFDLIKGQRIRWPRMEDARTSWCSAACARSWTRSGSRTSS